MQCLLFIPQQILETIGARLENLDLSWCGTVTDTTLKSVIDHCSNLTKLGLSFCKGITGEPMKELTFLSRKKQAKKLTKLALQACKQVWKLFFPFSMDI